MLVKYRPQHAMNMNTSNLPLQVIPPWPLDKFLARQGLVLSHNDDRRHFARLYYRRSALLEVATSLPAFERRCEAVNTYSCDISREGVSFLSPYELYPREFIALKIAELNRKKVVVVRCRRLAKGCFEVGARCDFANDELPVGL